LNLKVVNAEPCYGKIAYVHLKQILIIVGVGVVWINFKPVAKQMTKSWRKKYFLDGSAVPCEGSNYSL